MNTTDTNPYYRINITPHEWSQQHNLLVRLAKLGHEVYYVAPIFHDAQQLDLHSSAEEIMEQSIWVPTQHLHLQQREDRSCITYLSDRNYTVHTNQTQTRRSEPRYEYPEGSAVRRRIDREYYASLLRDLEEVVAEETGLQPDYQGMDLRSLQVSDPEDRRDGLATTCSPRTRHVPNGNRSRPSTISSAFQVQAKGDYGVREPGRDRGSNWSTVGNTQSAYLAKQTHLPEVLTAEIVAYPRQIQRPPSSVAAGFCFGPTCPEFRRRAARSAADGV